MDNNLAERMIRPMVLGRKNYWRNHAKTQKKYPHNPSNKPGKNILFFLMVYIVVFGKLNDARWCPPSPKAQRIFDVDPELLASFQQ